VQARQNLRQNFSLCWLAQFDFFTSQAKEAFWPAFVGAWMLQTFGERKFDQLLANEVCANPSPMNVSQLLAMMSVPTPRQ
jgi:hypothetical protein